MTRLVYARARRTAGWLLAFSLTCSLADAALRRTGEAMVAGQIGVANVRLTVGSVHHGNSELVPLFEGASVGESARITTGPDSHVLMALDPGGFVALDSKTDITIKRLRHVSDGLPSSIEDIKGLVEINLHAGQLKVMGASDNRDTLRVVTRTGAVEGDGDSVFIVASNPLGGMGLTSLGGSISASDAQGKKQATLQEGESFTIQPDGRPSEVTFDRSLQRNFLLWNNASERLRRAVTSTDGSPIRVAKTVTGVRPSFLGPARVTLDVSPTDPEPEPEPEPELEPVPPSPPEPEPEPETPDQNFRPPEEEGTTTETDTPVVTDTPEDQEQEEDDNSTPSLSPSEPGVRRSNEEVLSWYNNVGVIKGVNYTLPNTESADEMWSPEIFNPEQIRKDLDLAVDSGYTDIRVQLSIEEWMNDPEGFLNRFDEFASMTKDKGLRLVPVLLDPVEFTQSGLSVEQISLFVTTVMNNFKESGEVLYWDIFEAEGAGGLDNATYEMLRSAIASARGVGANQPVTVASLTRPDGTDLMLDDAEGSDLVTFSSFDPPEVIEAKIKLLKQLGRPVICTDWLNRTNDNTFEKLLPLFSANQVGWFNRGLVRSDDKAGDGAVWQDHVFDMDGNAYNASEIELIRGFIFEKEME
ncbi:MAG: hypothetical protein ACO398_07335 [Kiritimatiellia bacterium]